MPRIFISHSSNDKDLARYIALLLKDSLSITTRDICCTSAEPFILDPGIAIDAELRACAHDSDVFLALITASSLESTYVGFELGARWLSGRRLIPLISPQVDHTSIPAPLSSYQYVLLRRSNIRQLLHDLADYLGLNLERPSVYEDHLEKIEATAKAGETIDSGIPFFGYFYVEVDGMETILICTENNEWRFPFYGTATSSDQIASAINDDVSRFVRIGVPRQKDFLAAEFSSPEIVRISKREQKTDTKSVITPDFAYFFKLKVNDEFDTHSSLGSMCYRWVKKIPFLATQRIGNKKISIADDHLSFLYLMHKDKILDEIGYSVLECNDIIVFRETEQEEYEFLLLHRSDAQSRETGWEYPKGGLAYHESHREGGLRELLEETGVTTMGDFRFGASLGYQTPEVQRPEKPYNCLRVHGSTYAFLGDEQVIYRYVREGHSSEHDDAIWTTFQDARRSVWMKELGYPQKFFDRWRNQYPTIDTSIARSTSLAFEMVEDCKHTCRYCHRRVSSEKPLPVEQIKEIIDVLAVRRVKRLTFTGGEPLLYGKENLFKVIGHANSRHIHTCLSTTGIARLKRPDSAASEDDLQREDFPKLHSFLDQLLISVNCVKEESALKTYGNLSDWKSLKEKAMDMLRWASNTGIVVEVVTVVTKANIAELVDIWSSLVGNSTSFFWRIDEYYCNGLHKNLRDEFELVPGEFSNLRNELNRVPEFQNVSNQGRIHFNESTSRLEAPDVMISPKGNLVTTSNNKYEIMSTKDALSGWKFKNRRPSTEYKMYFRKWPWTALEEINGQEWVKRHKALSEL